MRTSSLSGVAIACALLLVVSSSFAQVAPPYLETFESEATCSPTCGAACVLSTTGWANDTVNDDFDWTVHVGATSSSPTGPPADHTTGTGKYLYTETSSPCFGTAAVFNLISPPLDLTTATAPFARFWYHMHGADMGFLHVDVSTDGGASWILDLIAPITDDIDLWQQTPNIDLTPFVGQMILIRLRSEGATNFLADMGIDDFELLEQSPNDVAVTAVRAAAPCGLGSAEHLIVEVTNFGTVPQSGFPVQVSVNGGTPLVETFTGTLQPFATLTYTFSGTVNLSGPGPFNLEGRTLLAGDGNPNNDAATGVAFNLPKLSAMPTIDSFEDPGALQWAGSGTPTLHEWELGTPSDGIINRAYDGTKSWEVDLDNTYPSNAQSFLTTGFCYDLSSTSNPAVSLAVWWDVETGNDGAALQASLDGIAWTTVGSVGTGTNWYNASSIVSMPGGSSQGWSGSGTSGSGTWLIASHALTGLAGESGVMLRIAFGSNASIVNEGFALDRVLVYDDLNGIIASNESFVPVTPSVGATNVLLQRLALFGTGSGDGINALTVTKLGTVPDADLTAAHLYLDNGNQALDPTVDTLLDTQTFTGGAATFNTSGNLTVGASQSQTLFVAVDIAGAATTGDTVGLEVAMPNSDIVTAGSTPVIAANLLEGPVLTIGGPLSMLPFVDVFGLAPANRTFLTAPGAYPTATALGITTTTVTTSNASHFEFFSAAGTFNQPPLSGPAYVVLSFPNGEATGAVEYAFDFSAYSAATDAIALAFRYGDNTDENDNEDYAFVSPDGGTTWVAVYSLAPATLANDLWHDVVVDLSGALLAAGLDYSSDFRIRLQGNDNSSLAGGDGLAFDEVLVDFGPRTGLERDGNPIAESGTDLLGTVPAVPQTLTYTITNIGGFELDLDPPAIFTGNDVNVQNIAITFPAPVMLAAGDSTTFQIEFEPGLGPFEFEVAFIVDNDSTLLDNAYNFIVSGTGADAGPEIDVQRPAGTSIGNGMSDPQGDVDTNATQTLTYTIENLGFEELSIASAAIGSESNATAQIVDLPANVLQPGETSELTLGYSPEGNGSFSFELQIGSNDADEGSYVIVVDGTGNDTTPGTGGAGGATVGAGGMGGSTTSGGSEPPPPTEDDGCGCRTAGSEKNELPALFALCLLALATVRRRRSRWLTMVALALAVVGCSDDETTSTPASTTGAGGAGGGTVAVCGDGTVQPAEACDDGNVDAGDGCDAACRVEPGFECDPTSRSPSECTPICGDGLVVGGEPCDDGNTAFADGCDDTCNVEPGWSCVGSPSVCAPGCGDGLLGGTEECDDGNADNGDGCSSFCSVEAGYACTGEPSVCMIACGNGAVDAGEGCDDGNVGDGDGCAADCQVEAGYECNGMPSVCTLLCGNGAVDAGEGCDDGDTDDGDGCSAACAVETGWSCDTSMPSQCTPACGDGVLLGAEVCDDGNTIAGDGCSGTCAVESGWTCNMAQPTVCTPTCGNGVVHGTEGCDDGNTTPGDGCSASCLVEAGYVCDNNSSPSVCTESCGDGFITASEACDDGGTTAGDGCSAACTVESGWQCGGQPSSCTGICGDGVLLGSEACDDGNVAGGDGCSQGCTVESGWECSGAPSVCTPLCGNGTVDPGETCDDGGSSAGDGCSANCFVEPGYACSGTPSVCTIVCGDGIIVAPEACDDGNQLAGDGCAANCSAVEPNFNCVGQPSDCNPQPSAAGQLAVTEFHPDPASVADTNGEWFEIVNLSTSALDLEGMTIADLGTDAHVIAAPGGQLLVAPGERVVLGNDSVLATNGGAPVDYMYAGFILANTLDEIVLVGVNSTVIDQVVYDTTFGFGAGVAAQLDELAANPATDNDIAGNWCPALFSYGAGDIGSPGAANSLCNANCAYSFDTGTLEGWTVTNSCATLPVGWTVDNTGQSSSPPYALYYGDPAVHNYNCGGLANNGTATSGSFTVPLASGGLQFDVWVATEGGATYDQLDLVVLPANTIVWERTTAIPTGNTGGLFQTFVVDLAPFAGQTIQLRWVFNTTDGAVNSTEGVYLDDIAITVDGACF